MPFSHHSHSGQFCYHAADTLEEVIRTAIEKKMQLFALTEHMPREQGDLYPEEVNQMAKVHLSELIPIFFRLRPPRRRKK